MAVIVFFIWVLLTPVLSESGPLRRSGRPAESKMNRSAHTIKILKTVDEKLNDVNINVQNISKTLAEHIGGMREKLNGSVSEVDFKNTLNDLSFRINALVQLLKQLKLRSPKLENSSNNTTDTEGTDSGRKAPNLTDGPSIENRLKYIANDIRSLTSGVNTVVKSIAEVKGARARSEPNTLGTVSLFNEFRRTMTENSIKKCECPRVSEINEVYPSDCTDIQMQGFNVSGIYKIKPDNGDSFYVLCELSTSGGGWTVFQNRFDGSQDFYKSWSDYKFGFGNLAGEFWLGLEKLYYITNQKLYELRIDIETVGGAEAYAVYSVFTIGPEHEDYRISSLGSYFGTAGDSLSYHAGQKFSTPDVDNDEWKDGSCANEHGGAWWYKECDKCNLNGRFTLVTNDENRPEHMYWITFKGPKYPLSKSRMMIRSLPAIKPGSGNRKEKYEEPIPELRRMPDVVPSAMRIQKPQIESKGRPFYRSRPDLADRDQFFV